MDYLRQGKPIDFSTVKELFDLFDKLHEDWEAMKNLVMTFVDNDVEKYKEEIKTLNNVEDTIFKIREDCAASLFYLVGKVELYKAKHGEIQLANHI
jgi:hypothetical protein